MMKYDMNWVMKWAMFFVVIQFFIYFANSFFQANFSHFDDNGDFSNWFTLSIELGIGLPIAFVIGNHFFIKSIYKAFELFKRERQKDKIRDSEIEKFMINCFGEIRKVINLRMEQNLPQKTNPVDRSIIILNALFEPDKIIEDFDDISKRLRSIPLKQSHDVAKILEKMVPFLKQVEYIYENIDPHAKVEQKILHKLKTRYLELKNNMERQEKSVIEKFRQEDELKQDKDFLG